jgi:hypothetical protein
VGAAEGASVGFAVVAVYFLGFLGASGFLVCTFIKRERWYRLEMRFCTSTAWDELYNGLPLWASSHWW